MMYMADNSTGVNIAGAIGLVLLAAVAIGVWWLPVFIAAKRQVPNIGSIAVITGLAGWTLIGYVVALAMAFRDLPAAPPPYSYGPPAGYSSGLPFPPPPPPHFPAGPFPPPQPQTGFRAPDKPR